MKYSLFGALLAAAATALVSCADDPLPAAVLFRDGDVLAATDTLLPAMAISSSAGYAADTTFFAYNENNQLTSVVSHVTRYKFTYGKHGRLTSLSWPNKEVRFEWEQNRVVSSTDWSFGQRGYHFIYHYDANGRLRKIDRYNNAKKELKEESIEFVYFQQDAGQPHELYERDLHLTRRFHYTREGMELQGVCRYTGYEDAPSLQYLLDLTSLPDSYLQQPYSLLYPSAVFGRCVSSYQWEGAGREADDFEEVRINYTYNSAGYPATAATPAGVGAKVKFVYEVRKKR